MVGKTYTFGTPTAYPPTGVWTAGPGDGTIGKFGVSSDGAAGTAAGPQVRSKADMPIPGGGGRSVPVDVSAKVPKPSAAAAIGRFAGRAVPVASTAFATYQLMKDLGFIDGGDPDGNGFVNWNKQDSSPGWCTTAPCYEYANSITLNGVAGGSHPYFPTPQQAADYAIGKTIGAGYPGAGKVVLPPANVYAHPSSPGDWQMCYVYSATEYNCGANLYKRTRAPDTGSPPANVASEQDLIDAIASMSGWPSRASQAMVEAINGGQTVTANTPTVTGPASVAGPSTTKNEPATKADGTPGTKTSVSNTTYNNTYNNNTMTTTVNTTTTVTYNYNDGTSKTETTTEEKEPECKEGAQTINCATLGTPEGDKIPKESKALTYAPESVGGGGSCPADVVRTVQGKTLTVFSYQQGCNLLASYVKPLVLALAAIMAYFILIPGGREGQA